MAVTTLEKLNSELRLLATQVTEDELVLIHKKLSLDLFAGVIKRTPVDTGEARGGWQITEAAASTPSPTNKKEQGSVGDAGGSTFQAGVEALKNLKPYQLLWITNAVPHAPVLDLGLFIPPNPGPSKDPREDRLGKILVEAGFSTQASDGIVEPALRDVLRSFG